VEFEGITNR